MSKLIINIDNSHFFVSRKSENLNIDLINAFIDQYADTQVAEINFSVNSMKASYDSHVFEPIWKDYDPSLDSDQPCLSAIDSPEERETFVGWMKCGLEASKNGKNIYQTWISRCREKGISPWISTRMNDLHYVNNEDHPIHSDFWKAHPEMRRIPYHFTEWTDKALDFGRKEVRERHFEFIREIAELYDIDGLELDWMRFGFHFRPGFEEEGIPILTEFTGDVRRLLDTYMQKRGHRIELSARVPSRPTTSYALGMDAVTWARKGLISRLIVTPFWASCETDMPVEIWKQLLTGTGVRLETGLEILLRPFPSSPQYQTNSIETARGAAMSFLHRGADDIYLFNYFDILTCMNDIDNYPFLLRECGNIETLRGKTRRHVITFSDTWAPGEAAGHILPCIISENECRSFRINIGEKPLGQKSYIIIGFKPSGEPQNKLHRLWVNGILCVEEPFSGLKKPLPESPVLSYRADSALHNGFNIIELLGYSGTIDWVEIYID